uniref:Uncharacterized protein n=1 Tax=Arundo donax TaxID=35708 RepID=A0A0A8Z1V5_ARUDO
MSLLSTFSHSTFFPIGRIS